MRAGDRARDFGNTAGGDIAYVGTCDASAEADTVSGGTVQNTVTLWVDGLYNAGKTAEIGEWQDPCPGGCQLQVDCGENQDSLAEFNLTIMRDANQGFFDVAVNFEDIFCSAKFDTCYDGDEHMDLLHGSDNERDWTGVFGFACTAGTGTADTTLLFSELVVDCGAAAFPIDPTLEGGKKSSTDSVGGVATLEYAIYRGVEGLDCGTVANSCNKAYWNLAFNLEDLAGRSCTLAFSATATDANKGFANGLPIHDGVAYPYIDVDVTLAPATCQQHALNDGGGVVTGYHGNVDGIPPASTMCHQFDGTNVGAVTGAICGVAQEAVCPCWDSAQTNALFASWLETLSYQIVQSDEARFESVWFNNVPRLYAGESAATVNGGTSPGRFCAGLGLDPGNQESSTVVQPITADEEAACLADIVAIGDNRCRVANGGCEGSTPLCFYDGPGASHCGDCETDADCDSSPVGPVCDTGANVCVEPIEANFDVNIYGIDYQELDGVAYDLQCTEETFSQSTNSTFTLWEGDICTLTLTDSALATGPAYAWNYDGQQVRYTALEPDPNTYTFVVQADLDDVEFYVQTYNAIEVHTYDLQGRSVPNVGVLVTCDAFVHSAYYPSGGYTDGPSYTDDFAAYVYAPYSQPCVVSFSDVPGGNAIGNIAIELTDGDTFYEIDAYYQCATDADCENHPVGETCNIVSHDCE